MSSVIRSAPAGGYAFVEKEEYRQLVWSGFVRFFGRSVDTKRVLLLPSIEGREVEVAIEHGFREENLFVVDKNPAIVATLKRRFSKIHTYGVTASRACKRIFQEGVILDGANLDFTGQVCSSLTLEMESILTSKCWSDPSFIAVTVMRGREGGHSLEVIQSVRSRSRLVSRFKGLDVGSRGITEKDAGRLFSPFLPAMRLDTMVTPVRCGAYLSPESGLTMLWGCFRIESCGVLDSKLAVAERSQNRKAFYSIRRQYLARLKDIQALAGDIAEVLQRSGETE